jgi:hypothetical protein
MNKPDYTSWSGNTLILIINPTKVKGGSLLTSKKSKLIEMWEKLGNRVPVEFNAAILHLFLTAEETE